MINFYYLNEDLELNPTDDPRSIEVVYKVGLHTFKGVITREPTELEALRDRVNELEAQLKSDAIEIS